MGAIARRWRRARPAWRTGGLHGCTGLHQGGRGGRAGQALGQGSAAGRGRAGACGGFTAVQIEISAGRVGPARGAPTGPGGRFSPASTHCCRRPSPPASRIGRQFWTAAPSSARVWSRGLAPNRSGRGGPPRASPAGPARTRRTAATQGLGQNVR